ncbi:MAG: hypothetical protein COA52_00455 [Hyphomicrobiales bacterium]|nr:MAG: hypothetical protein COA52_00455 [Hyphomicrobiales bacterium]
MKTLLVDIDGVLLDWVGGFTKWYEKNLHPNDVKIDFHHANVKDDSYCLAERYGIDKELIYYYINQFNRSGAFGSLESYDGLSGKLRNLSWGKGWQIYPVSSYLIDDGDSKSNMIQLRERNLNKDFPTFYHHVPLLLDSSKYNYLKAVKETLLPSDRLVFVDDKPANVWDGIDLGIETYMLKQPWNKNHELNKSHGKTWEEIYENLI